MDTETLNKILMFDITKDEDYINWLENFTNKFSRFSDRTVWLQEDDDEISQSDRDNICKLEHLYNIVKLYTNKNFIEAIEDQFGYHYQIKHHNTGYLIGVIYGERVNYWLWKKAITLDDKDSFIDFKLIQENKITEQAEIIQEKLNILTDLLNNMINEGVPIKAITKVTEQNLKLIRERK